MIAVLFMVVKMVCINPHAGNVSLEPAITKSGIKTSYIKESFEN